MTETTYDFRELKTVNQQISKTSCYEGGEWGTIYILLHVLKVFFFNYYDFNFF